MCDRVATTLIKSMQFQLPHLRGEPLKNYKTLYVLLYWSVNVIEL